MRVREDMASAKAWDEKVQAWNRGVSFFSVLYSLEMNHLETEGLLFLQDGPALILQYLRLSLL